MGLDGAAGASVGGVEIWENEGGGLGSRRTSRKYEGLFLDWATQSIGFENKQKQADAPKIIIKSRPKANASKES